MHGNELLGMNQGSGIIGRLLALLIALVGISIILGGARGPSGLARLILRPLFGGVRLVAKLAILFFVPFLFYQYATHRIASPTTPPSNPPPSSHDAGPPGIAMATVFDYPVGDEPSGERRGGKGWVVTQDFQDDVQFPDGAPHLRGTHLGEDWAHASGPGASAGRSVFSIADGEVVFSGLDHSYGHAVMIRHKLPEGSEYPYLIAMYGHLGATSLVSGAVGTLVKRGEPIGMVGWPGENGKSKTGKDWPAHLHFELRMDSSRSGFPDEDLSAGGWWGYHSPPAGFLNPTARGSGGRHAASVWIDEHR